MHEIVNLLVRSLIGEVKNIRDFVSDVCCLPEWISRAVERGVAAMRMRERETEVMKYLLSSLKMVGFFW